MLIISETKLDGTFPNSQFYVQGFCLSQNDRNIHGGGLMALVRSDICFTVVTEISLDLILRVKVGKSWITITGV